MGTCPPGNLDVTKVTFGETKCDAISNVLIEETFWVRKLYREILSPLPIRSEPLAVASCWLCAVAMATWDLSLQNHSVAPLLDLATVQFLVAYSIQEWTRRSE